MDMYAGDVANAESMKLARWCSGISHACDCFLVSACRAYSACWRVLVVSTQCIRRSSLLLRLRLFRLADSVFQCLPKVSLGPTC